MNSQEITFTLNSVLSILFGAGGALGVWFTLKGKVNLLEQEISVLEDQSKVIHGRIDSLKEDVVSNREKADGSVSTLKDAMQEMELRIIKAIHEIKK